MDTTTSGRSRRGIGTRAALAILLGLGVLTAGWVWPAPAGAERGLVDGPRGGPAPGGHWAPPAERWGHGPDAWRHRRHDDWGWHHRRPGGYGRHPGWFRGRGPGRVYCPGQWVWTGWAWAWAPGC